MDRFQFRLDASDPRQRDLAEKLVAAASGKRNALIVELLLRGAETNAAAPQPFSREELRADLREIVTDAIRDAGLQPSAPSDAAQPYDDIPPDVFDVLGKI